MFGARADELVGMGLRERWKTRDTEHRNSSTSDGADGLRSRGGKCGLRRDWRMDGWMDGVKGCQEAASSFIGGAEEILDMGKPLCESGAPSAAVLSTAAVPLPERGCRCCYGVQ